MAERLHAEFVERAPHPALRGDVRALCGYSERTAGPHRSRELPSAAAVLIVNLGPPVGVRDGTGPRQVLRSFAAGMHTAPAFVDTRGEQAGVEVLLTPFGARRLFGVPMHELAGVTLDLGDLIGERTARELAERAAGERAWAGSIAVVEQALLPALAQRPAPPPELPWAYHRVAHRPVRSIADELGWSQKRLVAAFRDHVGLPPKAVARVMRFERAAAMLRRDRRPLAEVAISCGYADQSHLTREVRELSGATPAALAAEGDFVQDATRAAA